MAAATGGARRLSRGHGAGAAFVLAALLATAFGGASARAEIGEVRIAEEYGVSYLPLLVMREQHLLEAEAKKAGLGDVAVSWTRFGSGQEMNDAILSGSLHFASGGVAPMVTLWSRTNGRVRGVAALNSMPLYLNSADPAIKTLADFTDRDRIGLPAVKVSMQAVTLQMAAMQAFGAGRANELDRLTVSIRHPDGMTALLSGHSGITAHFTSAPYMYQELANPRVHRVLNSYDVLGGPGSFNLVWAAQKFHDENPKTYGAFLAALAQAEDFIVKQPQQAAALYVKIEDPSLPVSFIENILVDPENQFTIVPRGVMKYAEFMHMTGMITRSPAKWSDMFFSEIAALPGS